MLGDNDIIASIDGRKNKATFDGDIKKNTYLACRPAQAAIASKNAK